MKLFGWCNHEFAEKIQGLIIQDLAKIVGNEEVIVQTGIYELYRCLDCKCVIWKPRKD